MKANVAVHTTLHQYIELTHIMTIQTRFQATSNLPQHDLTLTAKQNIFDIFHVPLHRAFLCHSRIIKMTKSLNCFLLYGRTLCYILADHNYHIFLFFSRL